MASSNNKEGKKETFKWTDEETNILCEVFREYIKDNGKTSFFKWKEIHDEVEKRIGRSLNNPSTCKNKYDAMRKDWIKWKALKKSETGLGWDPITGKIDAPREWWTRKLKENQEFSKFRQRGVSSIHEDHWEFLFGDSCATGDNVYVPSMDPIEDQTIEDQTIEDENVEEEGGEIDGSSQVSKEGGSKRDSKTLKETTKKTDIAPIKRAKRQSAGSAMMAKGITEMAECVKRMSQSSSTNVSTIADAMKIISHM
ncbi:L10-interacting MYB domain-containing protein, partial [Bienertia sinuspersici]